MTEARVADVVTSTEWHLRVYEQTHAGVEGSRWRAELENPEGRVVFAPNLQSSIETTLESVVSFLTIEKLRHTGVVLAELVRAEIKFTNGEETRT